jgi:ferric iron reductase protein FhuF
LSPVLAVAVTHGLVLDTDLGRAHWRPVLGGPYPLSFPAPRPVRTAPASTVDELADLLDRHVMQVSIRRIATTTRRVTPVASGLLWGNVASAVAGAVGQIAGAGPPLAPIAYGLAEALLDRPSLAGTGAFEAGYRFRRRSCCLIYRVGSNAAFCGDCPLSAPGTRRRTPDQG